MNCNNCNKTKPIDNYCENNKQFKTCIDCRNKSRTWRMNNKQTVSLYNKTYNENHNSNNTISYVYAKKYNSNDDWMKFNSQLEAANYLGIYSSNVNKVLNGKLKTTGGFIFNHYSPGNFVAWRIMVNAKQ